jgi:uncharacterized protein YjbI with pentapeptide repeats
MEAKPGSRWQKIKQHRLLTIGIIVVPIAFALAVWVFGWDWTGFNGGYSQITTTSVSHGTTTASVKPPGRTLWDLLQLLVIPVILTIGGLWFNQIQKDREQRATEQRAEREKREAEQRAKIEREAAEQRVKTEQKIAKDNQCETELQGYIDKMSDLLLKEHLRESEYEVQTIARARTLTVLQRLDSSRKVSLLQFLYEARLIDKGRLIEGFYTPIIDLADSNLKGVIFSKANLSKAHLREADLTGADLRMVNMEGTFLEGANLSGANLSGAWLSDAEMEFAKLIDADLRGADLRNADLEQTKLDDLDKTDLSKIFRVMDFPKPSVPTILLGATNLLRANLNAANLSGANLRSAKLVGVKLRSANLKGADLRGAIITSEQLLKIKSLKSATRPDESIHP